MKDAYLTIGQVNVRATPDPSDECATIQVSVRHRQIQLSPTEAHDLMRMLAAVLPARGQQR